MELDALMGNALCTSLALTLIAILGPIFSTLAFNGLAIFSAHRIQESIMQ